MPVPIWTLITGLVVAAGLCGCPGSKDTGDTAPDDSGTPDTGEPDDTGTPACPSPSVTFEGDDGASYDLTDSFLSGEYVTLALPGELRVCPGTWFSRVLIRADVSVVGLGASPGDTVLSGGLAGTILDVLGPDVTLNVHNVSLERGAGLDVEHNSGGGGIYCEQDGSVVVSDAIFEANEANDGPAIYTQECQLAVSDSTFRNNISEDDGGAVTLWDSTASFERVAVHDNQALDGGGMAVFNSQVTATELSLTDNRATGFSGGIWLYDSELIMSDGAFTGNQAPEGTYGGGLLVYGSATLERVSFSGNSAPLGGGIYVYYQGVVQGTDCDFADNSPQDIFASDGTTEGGQAYDAGTGTSFTCQDNACDL
jgi:predicted outer membrane repeat protein